MLAAFSTRSSPKARARRPRPDPFRVYSRAEAARYEAWYRTPAGRAVGDAEQYTLGLMLATLPAHQSVLEVGCGSGQFTRWLAARGSAAVRVDPSPRMLAVAREAAGA